MKGLKIIPMFLVLMVLTYVGMLFVESNHDDVVIAFGNYYQSQPIPLGFIVLTSILIGMVICGTLCSVELMALYMQNRNLKRRLAIMENKVMGGSRDSAKGGRHPGRETETHPAVPPSDVLNGT
jgi:uncharacterized integral membrane protein